MKGLLSFQCISASMGPDWVQIIHLEVHSTQRVHTISHSHTLSDLDYTAQIMTLQISLLTQK